MRMDFPITPLVPFRGGMVEIEAALYQATVQGPLGIAVDLIGSLAPLMGPPLSVAAAIAGLISEALDTALEEAGNQPALGLHWTMISPGGGRNVLRPGYLVLMDGPEPEPAGIPVILDGRLLSTTAPTAATGQCRSAHVHQLPSAAGRMPSRPR
jgi:hypothetical protein